MEHGFGNILDTTNFKMDTDKKEEQQPATTRTTEKIAAELDEAMQYEEEQCKQEVEQVLAKWNCIVVPSIRDGINPFHIPQWIVSFWSRNMKT